MPTDDPPDPGHPRPELVELRARVAATLDEGRPEAVARRRKTGQRTARENIADLVDEESWVEYGGLALAAQRQRLPVEELIKVSPADGLVAGVGAINGAQFGEDKARAMVLAYDYTVFAGTPMKKQLEAIEDPAKREEMFQSLVALGYERGKAINMASYLEIDAVIDPAETRAWLIRGIKSVPAPDRSTARRRVIDPW